MDTQPLLIGIDPPQNIKNEINRLKSKIIESCGYQQQVDAPSHCTFVVNNFTDIDSVSNVLKDISRAEKSIEINLDGIRYFPPEKSGMWMVHAGFLKNDALNRLQRLVVEKTSKYREGCLLCDYLKNNVPEYKYTKEEKRNVGLFGFPYVGENWEPHISVSILDESAFNKIGNDLINTKIDCAFKIDKITLFVHEGNWVPFKRYKLGN